ncbi:translation elongation factor Ts [Coxiella endosymbiont of Rhipicephalus microplus]|uniref:translation elongation factor Ts n=1 Tax=Coxiella endosymbiont of Rhipicephalus microplus TaxID=1656186 RepID=UPI000C80263C|nr:translation elongation factor Ts [Coxiella endosymbiont of Rhipicephalus microplus]PMB54742.1 Translation elongation factor Ts [Coxiella-like endosymbiont]
MITITAGMIKELREITGAGIMACKKALQTATGNINLAIKELRKAGEVTAAKLAHKKTAEGVIVIAVSNNGEKGFMAEINCQTDFVARDDQFLKFTQNVVDRGLVEGTTNVAATLALPYQAGSSITLEEARQKLITKIDENIQVRRVVLLSSDGGVVGHYSHGSRIGVLVALEAKKLALAKDIAIHIAAFNPRAIRPDDVPIELVEKEKEILIAQAKESGKSQEIINKMVLGRLHKFLKEISLEEQAFIKDPEIQVGDLLKSEKTTLSAFIRFEVGEGIQKDSHSFTNEVMAEVQGNL